MEDFDLLPEIPIDRAHTLDQLTARFATVRDGLPELIKNAKDQYSRLGIYDRNDRQIVVVADTERKSLMLLDFAGAASEDFAGWTTWSSRTANRADRSPDIEGGHGNGGKAFMVRGSAAYAYMESCANGRRTKMGFRNDKRAECYKPGYAKDRGVRIDDVLDPSPTKRLSSALSTVGIKLNDIPDPARAVFERRNAFTAVVVHGIREWEHKRESTVARLANELPQLIGDHGQAALTVETCDVWVVVDGVVITSEPLRPRLLEPYPGFEDLNRIPIPPVLNDPVDDEAVSTGPGDAKTKYLQLRTSVKHLRLSDDLKPRNVIRIWNERNNVASWPLAYLDVLLPATAFIYGELRVPSLVGDHLGDANRTTLSSTPLTRALHRWVSEQVEQLAQQITKAQARETKPEDREKAKRALTGLRDLMRAYLEAEPFAGDDDDVATGGNGQGNRGRRRTKRTSFGERVDEIVLEPTMRHISLALGTRVPVLFRCYEVQQDGTKKPVRDASTHLCSSDEAIGRPSDDLTVTALTEGVCELWVESNATGKLSNRISLEVIRSSEVDVLVPEEALRQGQRLKIRTVFHTERGPRDDLLIQATIDEPNMAWIGRHGLLTTGLQEGVATLRVRFGPDGTHQRAAEITIGAERVPPKGVGGAGGNIPDILLCGEEAPGMDAYPIDQRTHHGGDHYPTIIEEPQFPSVVWINPNSKEASRVRRSRGGPSGMGGIGTKTFMHFVALKCFEILKRLRVRQEIKEQTVNETQFCQLIAQAEMDCATFIDAAYELSEQLLRGEGEAS